MLNFEEESLRAYCSGAKKNFLLLAETMSQKIHEMEKMEKVKEGTSEKKIEEENKSELLRLISIDLI